MAEIISFHQKKLKDHFDKLLKFSRLSGYDPSDEQVYVVTYVVQPNGAVVTSKQSAWGDACTLAHRLTENANDKLVLSGDDYAIFAYADGGILKGHKLSDTYLAKLMEVISEREV